jgi:hypothetical protein
VQPKLAVRGYRDRRYVGSLKLHNQNPVTIVPLSHAPIERCDIDSRFAMFRVVCVGIVHLIRFTNLI